MIVYNPSDYQELIEEARLSERLRAHKLLHSSHQDKVQRLLIAFVKGSFVEPHFHELPNQWEMFSVLHGEFKLKHYHVESSASETFIVHSGAIIEVKPGEVHSVECLSEEGILLEVKEGPFDPNFAKVPFNKLL